MLVARGCCVGFSITFHTIFREYIKILGSSFFPYLYFIPFYTIMVEATDPVLPTDSRLLLNHIWGRDRVWATDVDVDHLASTFVDFDRLYPSVSEINNADSSDEPTPMEDCNCDGEDPDISLPALMHGCERFYTRIQELWAESRLRGQTYTNAYFNKPSRDLSISAAVLYGELVGLTVDLDKVFGELETERKTFVELLGSLDHLKGMGMMPTPWEQLEKLDDMGLMYDGIRLVLKKVVEHNEAREAVGR